MKFTYTSSKGNENSAGNNNYQNTQKDSNFNVKQQYKEKTYEIPHFDVVGIIGQVYLFVQRAFVYLKYTLNRLFPSLKGELHLPWFKIAVIGCMVFILFKKDLQFSVNMKVPTEEGEVAKVVKDELGFVQAASFLQPSKEETVVTPTDEEIALYIKRFKKVAETEYQKYGVPVGVKFGQAILASRAGLAAATKEKDNHFGQVMSGQNYNNAWENWRMHSLLLKEQYASAFEAEDNYIEWANELQKQGYSSDKNYAKKLIRVIEKYNLMNI